jgi:hypothetical protein
VLCEAALLDISEELIERFPCASLNIVELSLNGGIDDAHGVRSAVECGGSDDVLACTGTEEEYYDETYLLLQQNAQS